MRYNNASSLGAGIRGFDNDTVIDCDVSYNINGGIYYTSLADDPAVFVRCASICNSNRPGMYIEGGIVSNCTVQGNYYPYGNGGGMYIKNCQVYNSLIGYNHATIGGGIYCHSNSTVQNCTIVSNAVQVWGTRVGGGIYILTNDVNIVNSIIVSNKAQNGGDNWFTNISYGCAFSNCCALPADDLPGAGNTDQDPLFADFDGGNFRLTARSPCANSGLNQEWMAGALDLDGRPRIGRYGNSVDMGAYEFVPRGAVFSLR